MASVCNGQGGASTDARRYTLRVGSVAALAGLMFGLDVGAISGAADFIQKDFHASDLATELVVSSMMVGAALGAAAGIVISRRLGRRFALTTSGLLFVSSSLASAGAWSPASLIGARLVLGLALGIAAFTAPLYIAEVAPQARRGAMISAYQLAIAFGILIAYLSDTGFSYMQGWRWMLGVIAIPGAIFTFGVLALPESPRWLVLRGRDHDATSVLAGLRGSVTRAKSELESIRRQLSVKQNGWKLFRGNRNFRRSVALGVALQIVQQLTGISTVMYYAPRIFGELGYGTELQMWFTVTLGVSQVVWTGVAILFVDRIGRRLTLYGGFAAMAVGLLLAAVVALASGPNGGDGLVSVGALLLFVAGFSFSAGPLVWTLCSEIQPLRGRDFGIGVSTITNWVLTALVGASFLTLLDRLGTGETFLLYAALDAVFLLFTWAFVPETKGASLEDIERRLMRGVKMRDIGGS